MKIGLYIMLISFIVFVISAWWYSICDDKKIANILIKKGCDKEQIKFALLKLDKVRNRFGFLVVLSILAFPVGIVFCVSSIIDRM